MDKTFPRFDLDQQFLLPPSLDEWLPADHLARFVAELVGDHLDLPRFLAAIVEPVFGQMHTRQNAKQFLLRGLDGAKGEWLLVAACHNRCKLHSNLGTGLRGLAPG